MQHQIFSVSLIVSYYSFINFIRSCRSVAHLEFQDVDTLLRGCQLCAVQVVVANAHHLSIVDSLDTLDGCRGIFAVVLIATGGQQVFVQGGTSAVVRITQHISYQTGIIGAAFVVGVIVGYIVVTRISFTFLLCIFLTDTASDGEMVKLVVLQEILVMPSHIVLTRLDDRLGEVAILDIQLRAMTDADAKLCRVFGSTVLPQAVGNVYLAETDARTTLSAAVVPPAVDEGGIEVTLVVATVVAAAPLADGGI